jgi:hypothetical protein
MTGGIIALIVLSAVSIATCAGIIGYHIGKQRAMRPISNPYAGVYLTPQSRQPSENDN